MRLKESFPALHCRGPASSCGGIWAGGGVGKPLFMPLFLICWGSSPTYRLSKILEASSFALLSSKSILEGFPEYHGLHTPQKVIISHNSLRCSLGVV